MYTRNLLWLVSLVSAAPLYAADVPANTPLAPQQVFRYNNHSDSNNAGISFYHHSVCCLTRLV